LKRLVTVCRIPLGRKTRTADILQVNQSTERAQERRAKMLSPGGCGWDPREIARALWREGADAGGKMGNHRPTVKEIGARSEHASPWLGRILVGEPSCSTSRGHRR